MEQNIITIENCTANAVSATELKEACAPKKRGVTLAERWAEFWSNRAARLLRQDLARERAMLDSLDDRARDKKHHAQQVYSVALVEIDSWRDSKAASCKLEIARIKAKLAKMGEE